MRSFGTVLGRTLSGSSSLVNVSTWERELNCAHALAGLAARGIRLNPNATDTDFDGLADGQELFVKSVKTPKRYPIPDRTAFADGSAWTPVLVPGIAAPAAMVSSALAMVGITHELMGELQVDPHPTYR